MAISSNGVAGLKTGVCTSTTRPSGPYEGQMIYETDTDMVAIWNGSAWRYLAATTPTNGSVLQIVTGTTTTQLANATTTYADAGLSASITPKSTTSKILVLSSLGYYNSTSASKMKFNIVRGSTQINETNPLGGDAANIDGGCTLMVLDSPGTTSSTTYKVQFRIFDGGGTTYIRASSTAIFYITLMEIAG